MSQVNTQLAYVLHKRLYRESSQIIDVFSRDHGRLSLMSRGSRGAKSRISGNLQLFSPLLLGWQGRGSMPYLRSVERADIKPPVLPKQSLLSAMYVNELLTYLVHKHDVQSGIFDCYHQCLYALQNTTQIEIELRKFEIKMLELLGFGLQMERDADSGEKITAEQSYLYYAEHGPVAYHKLTTARPTSSLLVQGCTLLALLKEDYQFIEQDKQQMQQLKHLMRYIIHFHLGGRPLKSRELFNTL